MNIKHSYPLTEFSPWQITSPTLTASFHVHLRTKLCVIWYSQLKASPRYQAGMEYATAGSVQDIISNKPGVIEAQVKGSQSTPYTTSISFPKLSIDTFDKLLKSSITSSDDLERLCDGDLLFFETAAVRTHGFSFLPLYYKLIQTTCSCPYKQDFCKHALAVLCILLDVLDEEPLTYFMFCGLPVPYLQDFLLKKEASLQADIQQANRISSEFCTTFWGQDNATIKNMEKKVSPPQTDAAAILKQGKIPIQLNKKFADAFFQEIYHAASSSALKMLQEEVVLRQAQDEVCD